MRVLRAVTGALLWILASVLGLVAVVLCATVILLPVGIPLLLVTRRLFGRSVRLFLPRAAAHPLKTIGQTSTSAASDALEGLGERASRVRHHGARRTVRGHVKKGRKRLRKGRKRLRKATGS